MISPSIAYLIWFIVLVVILYFMLKFNYSYLSAFTVATTLSLYTILIIYPYRLENNKYSYQETDKFLMYIILASVLIITLFVIYKGLLSKSVKASENVQTLRIVTK